MMYTSSSHDRMIMMAGRVSIHVFRWLPGASGGNSSQSYNNILDHDIDFSAVDLGQCLEIFYIVEPPLT